MDTKKVLIFLITLTAVLFFNYSYVFAKDGDSCRINLGSTDCPAFCSSTGAINIGYCEMDSADDETAPGTCRSMPQDCATADNKPATITKCSNDGKSVITQNYTCPISKNACEYVDSPTQQFCGGNPTCDTDPADGKIKLKTANPICKVINSTLAQCAPTYSYYDCVNKNSCGGNIATNYVCGADESGQEDCVAKTPANCNNLTSYACNTAKTILTTTTYTCNKDTATHVASCDPNTPTNKKCSDDDTCEGNVLKKHKCGLNSDRKNACVPATDDDCDARTRISARCEQTADNTFRNTLVYTKYTCSNSEKKCKGENKSENCDITRMFKCETVTVPGDGECTIADEKLGLCHAKAYRTDVRCDDQKLMCVPQKDANGEPKWEQLEDCGVTHVCNGQTCQTLGTGKSNPFESNTTHKCVISANHDGYSCENENNIGAIDSCEAHNAPTSPPFCGSDEEQGSGIEEDIQTYVCADLGVQVYTCTSGYPAMSATNPYAAPKANCVKGPIEKMFIPCGPPGEATVTYCTPGVDSVRCTITIKNPGECETTATGPICKPLDIKTVCEDRCDDNDDNPPPPPPPCAPEGGTQPCPNGGSQTCGSDGWSPCPPCEDKVCPDGSTVDCTKNCLPCTKTCPNGAVVDCDLTCPNCPNPCPDGSCNTTCPPCQTKSCPDGSEVCDNIICPPCSETCEDGSKVPCGKDCPPCIIDCGEGKTVSCGEECPAPPPSDKNHCNEYGKCVAGKGKINCSKPEDCESSCKINFQCKPGGGGAVCSENTDCLLEGKKCVLNNGVKQCRPDNCGGKECGVDSECESLETFCDRDCKKCVPGGDTGIECSSDVECQYGCTANNPAQCVFGGAGGICSPYSNDCSSQELRCVLNDNGSRQCIKDDCGGEICSTVANCNQTPTCDSKCQKCVPGGDTRIPCSDDSICKIVNKRPEAKNLNVVNKPCTGNVSFQWTYSDGENDPEYYARLEIDNNADFLYPEFIEDIKYTYPPALNLNQQLVPVKYNVGYYWRVMVLERIGISGSQASEWTYYDGQSGTTNPELAEIYIKTGHPDPSPRFTVSPNPAVVDVPVNFKNSSLCYSDSECNYKWWFGDPHTPPESPDSTNSSASHSYAVKKTYYTATLEVCDEQQCCPASRDVTITPKGLKDLPIWKEISPFW